MHAGGTRYESPHAPIAPGCFPFNHCEVWACRACGRGLLQSTEFGAYCVDHRLREVDTPIRFATLNAGWAFRPQAME